MNAGRLADIRYGGIDHGGNRVNYLTPSGLRRKIESRYGGGEWFDPCPWPAPPWDGLKVIWRGKAFVNPPYSKDVGEWLEKGIGEIAAGNCSVAVYLLHSRTGTSWFHKYILGRAQEIRFYRGRVAFPLPGKLRVEPAPFDSVIVAFYPEPRRWEPIVGAWA